MRTFKLVRNEDASGVSGTGEVAEGVEFKNGKCVMCWDTDTSSVAIYENVQDLVNIHGHQGRTVVKFDDGETVSDIVIPESIGEGSIIEIINAGIDKHIWVGMLAVVLDDSKSTFKIAFIGVMPKDSAVSRITNWEKDWVKLV